MDAGKTKAQLAAELQALRRRVSELETVAAGPESGDHKLTQALLESASEGILLIDAAGRITLINRAAERMFGYTRAELLHQHLEMLLPERIRGAHVGHRTGYFAGPRVRPMGLGIDLAGRRKDGEEFPVEISLGRHRARDNNPLGIITTRIEVMLLEAKTRIAASLRSFARQSPSERSAVDLNAVVERPCCS